VAALDDNLTDDTPRSGGGAARRVAVGLTAGLLVTIIAVSARTDPGPVEPRTGRRVELVELIRAEQERTKELEATVAQLSAEVVRYESREVDGAQRIARLQRRIDRISAAAGVAAVRGPGVRVVLTDSALDTAPTGNLNDLVIHEEDLQAVINALWAGGAEAISVNGQRILATTAIRCVGNTLLLHGAVYSPPYEIQAVGDDVALQAELARDPGVERFRGAVRQFKLGFTTEVVDELTIPAYDGAAALAVAQPAEET